MIILEKFFNSKFMVGLQAAGQKVGANKFLSSVQNAMTSLMAVIMVGAICVILNTLLGPSMLNLIQSGTPVSTFLVTPYQFTMNFLSVWVMALLSYNYAKNLKLKNPLITMVDSLVVFLLAAAPVSATETGNVLAMSYLGASGMFPGFLIVFISVQIEKFCELHNAYIRMPEIVPPAIQGSFAAIVPLLLSVAVFSGATVGISVATGGAYTICSGFMALLQAPLGAMGSLPGIILMYMLAALLWCFGIHGTTIVGSILTPIIMAAFSASNDAVAAGGAPILAPIMAYWYIQACGGSGNTLALCIMGLRSKSEQIKAVSRAGIAPACFGINEPVTFGMPIMYNPIMAIPFILTVPVNILLGYAAMVLGVIATPFVYVTGLMPIGLVSYLRSMDIRNFIFDWLLVIPNYLLYYPFFKAYEKQLVAKEQEAQEA